MEIAVYLDVLFALNFLMDLVMVFLTALVVKTQISIGRISLAAGILAFYGTLIAIPRMHTWFSLAGRIAVSLGSVSAFCPKGKRCKGMLVFWLISVSLGGGVIALSMMHAPWQAMRAVLMNGSLYMETELGILMAGIGITYGLIWGFCRISVRNFGRERVLIPFRLTLDGQEICFTVLMDTGCELTVPGTGDAMLLLSKAHLKGLSPKESFSVTIDTATGEQTIPAFYPERLTCLNPQYCIQGIPAIGIAKTVFAKDGLYAGVCNPDMLWMKDGGEQDEEEKICLGEVLAETDKKAGDTRLKKGALHRRKRDLAAAPWQGGGSRTAEATGQSGKQACCTADPD